jgi:peroxiredoxin
MEREIGNAKFGIGSALPEFSLPATTGGSKGSDDLKNTKAALVVFTCNHCPYVKGTDEMLISIVRKFERDGLKTIAISSNDATQYPDDSFENMKKKTVELSLPYLYLYDESQSVAKMFDAQCTPECYLFDASGKLAYHGTINDSPRDPSRVTKDYLSTAIAQVLEGQKADPSFIRPIGCSIKWKSN